MNLKKNNQPCLLPFYPNDIIDQFNLGMMEINISKYNWDTPH